MSSSRVSLCVLVAALTSAGFSCDPGIAAPVRLSMVPNADPIQSAGTFTLQAEVDMERITGTVVRKVEFYRGSEAQPTYTDDTAPYEYPWQVAGDENGAHRWHAVAHVSFEGTTGTDEWTSNVLDCTVAIGTDPVGEESSGVVGFIPGIGTANDTAVVGNIAYIASAEFGLSVIDVANPSAPQFLASSDVPFEGLRVDVQADRAVVAGKTRDQRARLWVLDIGDPLRPRVEGELETDVPQGTSVGIQDVVLDASGNTALTAMGSDGLWAIDLSLPDSPERIGSYDTPGTAYGLELYGAHAYIADGIGDLVVLNVEDPAQPSFVAHKSLSGIMRDVAIEDGIAYLADQQGSMKVVDVSTPSAPRLTGSQGSTNGPRRIEVEDGRVVLFEVNSTGNVLEVFSVAPPASPQLTATIDLTQGMGFSLGGYLAFVAEGDHGFQVYDVRSSSPPVGSVTDSFEAHVVTVRDGIAVLGGSDRENRARFVVVNVQSPSDPFIEGELSTNVVQGIQSGALDLAFDASGDMVVAAMGTSGVWVVDVSVPSEPRLAGSYDTPGTAYGVAVSGEFVYVADGPTDLQVITIADPSRPSLVTAKSVTGIMRDVALLGDLAYLVNQQGGLSILDVSDPAAPRLVGVTGTTAAPRRLGVEDGRIVTLEISSSGGQANTLLEVFDVSATPTSPERSADITLDSGRDFATGIGRSVAVRNALAFVAQGSNGLKVFYLTDADPPLVYASPVVGHALDVAVGDNYAYIADSKGTVSIIPITP